MTWRDRIYSVLQLWAGLLLQGTLRSVFKYFLHLCYFLLTLPYQINELTSIKTQNLFTFKVWNEWLTSQITCSEISVLFQSFKCLSFMHALKKEIFFNEERSAHGSKTFGALHVIIFKRSIKTEVLTGCHACSLQLSFCGKVEVPVKTYIVIFIIKGLPILYFILAKENGWSDFNISLLGSFCFNQFYLLWHSNSGKMVFYKVYFEPIVISKLSYLGYLLWKLILEKELSFSGINPTTWPYLGLWTKQNDYIWVI